MTLKLSSNPISEVHGTEEAQIHMLPVEVFVDACVSLVGARVPMVGDQPFVRQIVKDSHAGKFFVIANSFSNISYVSLRLKPS